MCFVSGVECSACLSYVLSEQSRNIIWYMPLLSYLPIRECCFTKFCIVFHVLNDIFISVSLINFVIFSCFIPLYVKLAHFVFRYCGSVFVCCFLVWVFNSFIYIIFIVVQCIFLSSCGQKCKKVRYVNCMMCRSVVHY